MIFKGFIYFFNKNGKKFERKPEVEVVPEGFCRETIQRQNRRHRPQMDSKALLRPKKDSVHQVDIMRKHSGKAQYTIIFFAVKLINEGDGQNLKITANAKVRI